MSFDSDAFKGNLKRLVKPTANPLAPLKGSEDPGNVFRTGRSSAKKLQEKQSLLIERQRQQTAIELSEADSEIASRKALAKSGRAGRRSLISTSEQGATTLGGGS